MNSKPEKDKEMDSLRKDKGKKGKTLMEDFDTEAAKFYDIAHGPLGFASLAKSGALQMGATVSMTQWGTSGMARDCDP